VTRWADKRNARRDSVRRSRYSLQIQAPVSHPHFKEPSLKNQPSQRSPSSAFWADALQPPSRGPVNDGRFVNRDRDRPVNRYREPDGIPDRYDRDH